LRGETGVPTCIEQGTQAYADKEDFEFLSTDLKAASDYLHHSVNQAVWAAIWSVIGTEFPCAYQWVGQVLVGPMMLDPKTPDLPADLKGFLGKPSTRGALMGLPLAWPILTIVNEWAASRASPQGGRKTFETCGDDMAAAWLQPMTEKYFTNLKNAGLVVNKKKTFRSKTGLIFVEKLFLLSPKIKVEKLPPLPTGHTGQFAEAKHIKSDDTISHRIISRLKRPTLSAISQARRHGGGPSDDTVPAWATLGQTISEEMEECNARQAKLLPVIAEYLHPDTYRIWRQSGIPLHWPRFLGGWGLPGKPSAPDTWLKAAALMVSHKDPSLLRSLSRAYTLARLTGPASDIMPKVQVAIDDNADRVFHHVFDEEIAARSQTKKEVEQEATTRVTSFFSLLTNKAARSPPIRLSTLTSRIKTLIKDYSTRWESVNPMDPVKAIQAAQKLLDQDNLRPVIFNLDREMENNQVFDHVSRKDMQKLQPEQRVRLFVRSFERSNRAAPASGASAVPTEVREARNVLFDMQGMTEVPPDSLSTETSNPSYSFNPKTREQKYALQCRKLMQVASTNQTERDATIDAWAQKNGLNCRDQAGRFSPGCTPAQRAVEDALRVHRTQSFLTDAQAKLDQLSLEDTEVSPGKEEESKAPPRKDR
jgi:hypothetical protein